MYFPDIKYWFVSITASMFFLVSCNSSTDEASDPSCDCPAESICCENCQPTNIGELCSEEKSDLESGSNWDARELFYCGSKGSCGQPGPNVSVAGIYRSNYDYLFFASDPISIDGENTENIVFGSNLVSTNNDMCHIIFSYLAFSIIIEGAEPDYDFVFSQSEYKNYFSSNHLVEHLGCQYGSLTSFDRSPCIADGRLSLDGRLITGIQDDALHVWSILDPFCPPYDLKPECFDIETICCDDPKSTVEDVCIIEDPLANDLATISAPGRVTNYAIHSSHFPVVVVDDLGHMIGYEGWGDDTIEVFHAELPGPTKSFLWVGDRYAISAGGNTDSDDILLIWDTQKNEEHLRFTLPGNVVELFADKSESRLFAASNDADGGHIFILDITEASLLAQNDSLPAINSLVWNADGQTLAAAAGDVWLLDADDLSEIQRISITDAPATGAVADADFGILATGHMDGRIALRRLSDGAVMWDWSEPIPTEAGLRSMLLKPGDESDPPLYNGLRIKGSTDDGWHVSVSLNAAFFSEMNYKERLASN